MNDQPILISKPEPSPTSSRQRRRRRPTLDQLALVANIARHNFLESETLSDLGVKTVEDQDRARRAFVAFTDWLSAQKEKAGRS